MGGPDGEVVAEGKGVFVVAVAVAAYGGDEFLARSIVRYMAAHDVRLPFAATGTLESIGGNILPGVFFPKFYPVFGSVSAIIKMTHFSFNVCLNPLLNEFGQTHELMFCNFKFSFVHN